MTTLIETPWICYCICKGENKIIETLNIYRRDIYENKLKVRVNLCLFSLRGVEVSDFFKSLSEKP